MATTARHTLPAEPSAKLLVLTLAAATFVTMTSALGLGPFLPVLAHEFGTPVAVLGQIPAAMLLLAALLGLVIGPLADHFGYRRVLVTALLTVVASALATGFAPNFPLLLLATMIGAVGRAAVLPVAQAFVAARYPEDDARRRALSWINMGISSSLILGLPLLATIASFTHWRVAFLVLSGAALGMTVLLGRILSRDAAQPSTRPTLRGILAAYAPILRHRPTLCLIGGNLLGSAAQFVILTYLAVFLAERHGLDTREVGWAYLIVGLGALLGNWLAGGRLGARSRPMMIAVRLLGGCVVAAALLLPVPLLLAVGLLSLSMLLYTPGVVATALLLAAESPAGRATTLTVNVSALGLGQGLGGALGGLALVVGDWAAVGLCPLALMLAAAGLAWLSGRHENEAPAPMAL
jgi:MFS transporter, DHA1 family, purine base/nucleoside efflux pump